LKRANDRALNFFEENHRCKLQLQLQYKFVGYGAAL